MKSGSSKYFGIMKIRYAGFWLLLVLLHVNATAQSKSWPPADWLDTSIHYGNIHRPSIQMVKGYMVLKSGDSLTGYMYLYPYQFYKGCYILEPGKFSARLIRVKKIRYIVADIASLGHNETKLVTSDIRHPHRAFWRLIGKKGEISIYDLSMGIFSHLSSQELTKKFLYNLSADTFNDDMYMVTKEGTINIYRSVISWGAGDRSLDLLIKFINRRYHQAFKKTDFASGMAMVNYILDRENEPRFP
jgi:hypothetical protein